MAHIKHPVFPDQTKEVPDDKLDDWIAAGWTKDESVEDTDAPVLTSFEQAVLDQESGEVQLEPASVSYQPTLLEVDKGEVK